MSAKARRPQTLLHSRKYLWCVMDVLCEDGDPLTLSIHTHTHLKAPPCLRVCPPSDRRTHPGAVWHSLYTRAKEKEREAERRRDVEREWQRELRLDNESDHEDDPSRPRRREVNNNTTTPLRAHSESSTVWWCTHGTVLYDAVPAHSTTGVWWDVS